MNDGSNPTGTRLIGIVAGVMLNAVVMAQPAGYGYGQRILISGARIAGSSALMNFPVLIDVSSPSLRKTSNGGRVQNANGYDISFTAGDCNTNLSFQLESYTSNATTGRLVAWVLVPAMVPGVDLGIHMYYGKSGVSTDPSSTSVWTNYHAVWHLQTNTLNDNSPSGYNATNNATTAQNPAYINKGRALDGTQWMELSTFPNLTTSYSMSAWIYSSDIAKSGQRIFADDVNNTGGYAFSISDEVSGTLRFFSRSCIPVSLDTPSGTIAANTWYYATAVVDISAKMKYIYVNGVLKASGAYTGTWGTDAGNASIGGETASGETANRLKGRIDEVHVAKSKLSADWLRTEYNNQSDPASFYTLSGEYTASSLCTILPIELLYFNATNVNVRSVALAWSTASEKDNDHFVVERSTDTDDWTTVAQIPGAGNSDQVIDYSVEDPRPENGINYYRLRQVDIDGAFSISPVSAVDIGGGLPKQVELHPNPASSELNIRYFGLVDPVISLVDMHGRVMLSRSVEDPAVAHVNVADLPEGIYLVTLTDGRSTQSARVSIQH